ncbi:spermidine synthase [Betaproteobacteria bacterium]|nr:spermidine synthase [Betaproteobacteria bacterium]GHU10061.1 spermidine synthase [Betaproteobacteria bacterium]GHU46222.1 spermidine synthase [Betaproteobacteria bacterium]
MHSIDISESKGVRYLHFGSEWVQGAMRIARPFTLELAYTQEMLLSLLLSDAPPQHCLLVGLGTASQLKFLHRHFPDTRFTVLEINPGVVAVAQQFFRLPDSPRIEIIMDDAAAWLAQQAPRAKFDLILQDGFNAAGRTGALSGAKFYDGCRAALTATGVFSCNLLGSSRGFKANLGRIREAFAGRKLHFSSADVGNVIALGVVGKTRKLPLETLRERALALKEQTGLDLRPAITHLQLTTALPDACLKL